MIGFYLFLALEKLLMLLPKKTRRSFFLFLSKVAYLLAKKHRRIIRQNIHFLFGDAIDDKTIQEYSRYCFDNLLLNFLQILEGRYLSFDDLFNSVHIKNQEILDKALQEKRPIIFATAHFGTWEIAGAYQGAFVGPWIGVYKEFNNKYFEKYMLESRAKFNISMVKRKGAVRHLLKTLKKGGATSLLIDQNISQREGIMVKFFNKDVLQTPTPAYLAQKTGALLIPVFVHNEADGNYTIKFHDAIEIDKASEEKEAILKASQQLSDALEMAIRENPKMWFWCHRRFKETHPEIYRRDK